MPNNPREKTFIGFWPADDNYSAVDPLELNEISLATELIQKELRDTLLEKETDDWHIIVCKDYMCLLHLKHLEAGLNQERENNRTAEIYQISLGVTRKTKNHYIEALNAYNFLFFSACFTGRNNYFLHDYSEVTIWQCLRVMYSSDNKPLRRIQFGRGTKKEMSRSGLCVEEKAEGFLKIPVEIFQDAIHYWDIIYGHNLIGLASIGSKILSEHRLESYNLSVVLAWFEVENWIMDYTRTLGIQTSRTNSRNGRVYHFGIKDIIDSFPTGTTVSNLKSDIHEVRDIRNAIAHRGVMPSHDESSKAIELFVKMFNIRSGLNIRVDSHKTPSGGM